MKRTPLRCIFILFITLSFTQHIFSQKYTFTDGSIFLDSAMINQTDPSSFLQSTATGEGVRYMFDRRTGSFDNYNVFLFEADYQEGFKMEFRINKEFGSVANAQKEVDKYAPLIGQLPTLLKNNIQHIDIHMGNFPYGGGNNGILIHTGITVSYEAQGHLEEALFHEACHTSLDDPHASSGGWIAAQIKDDHFITKYAWENPHREDIAESFLLYTAVRYQADRISRRLNDDISKAIPNRMAYFDSLDIEFNMWPLTKSTTGLADRKKDHTLSVSLFPNPATHTTRFSLELDNNDLLTIQLLNLNGQQVKRIADQLWVPPGAFQKNIDLTDVLPGLYILQFETSEGVATKKLVVH